MILTMNGVLTLLVVSVWLTSSVSGFTPTNLSHASTACSTSTALHALQSESDNNDSSSLDRRSVLSTLASSALLVFTPISAVAAAPSIIDESADVDGVPAITRSGIGTSFRRATVRSAQIADKIDERWERFSDSLRDESKCDPNTGRRMFDNGFRRDGTRIGNPVLGDLCVPEPLLPMNDAVAELILGSAEEEAVLISGSTKDSVRRKVSDVDDLVGPSFARAKPSSSTDALDKDAEKRLGYNRKVYSRMRAYGELLLSNKDSKTARAAAADFELQWGSRLLFDAGLVPIPLANRKSFKSPFPPLSDEDKGDLAYDEGALLDGLGTVSAALDALQAGGIIGHWEISIPTDDYGEVVTIAIDDDISLGAQALLREGRSGLALNGSVVTAITRAALKKVGVTAAIDAFFLDPSTTKQDVFDPSQLLLNLSNIKGT